MRFFASLLLFAIAPMSALFAYVQSSGETGVKYKWNDRASTISFYSQNNSTLTSALVGATATWVGESRLTAEVAGITDSRSARRNEVYYSNDLGGNDVLAKTTVAYDEGTGEIVDADIAVRTGLGSKLQAVLTHEIGHALGLGHSEVKDSTMFWSYFDGQETLHTDDIAGVHTLYPISTKGTISGKIVGGNSLIPILGAHVQAVSAKSGSIYAGAYSLENGTFSIGGLSTNDVYYLYVSPIKAKDALPTYFNSSRKDFCAQGSDYRGSFFKKCGAANLGFPQGIQLSTSTISRSVGNVSIGCEISSPSNYLATKITGDTFTLSLENGIGAFVGYFSDTQIIQGAKDTLRFDFSSYSGVGTRARFNVLSQGIYSPLLASYDFDGIVTSFDVNQDQFIDFFKEDNTLDLDYNLEITPEEKINGDLQFPDAENFLEDDILYFVNAIALNSSGVPQVTLPSITDNSSCPDAPDAYRVLALTSLPPVGTRDSFKVKTEDPSLISCGTVDLDDNQSGGPFQMILGFLMGLLFAVWRRENIKKAWIPMR